MKKEAAARRKWVADDAMNQLDQQLIAESGCDSLPKKEMTFGQTDNVDGMQQTQQNWVIDKIDGKGN